MSILVPELLSTHPFFMGKEPDVDDPACILGGRREGGRGEREREREREVNYFSNILCYLGIS